MGDARPGRIGCALAWIVPAAILNALAAAALASPSVPEVVVIGTVALLPLAAGWLIWRQRETWGALDLAMGTYFVLYVTMLSAAKLLGSAEWSGVEGACLLVVWSVAAYFFGFLRLLTSHDSERDPLLVQRASPIPFLVVALLVIGLSAYFGARFSLSFYFRKDAPVETWWGQTVLQLLLYVGLLWLLLEPVWRFMTLRAGRFWPLYLGGLLVALALLAVINSRNFVLQHLGYALGFAVFVMCRERGARRRRARSFLLLGAVLTPLLMLATTWIRAKGMRDLSLGEDQISSIAESVSVQRGYEESAFALDTEFERADFALFLGPVLNGSGPLGLLPAERLVPLYATGVCGALPRLAVSAFRCHRTSMEAEVGRIFGAGFVDRDLLTFFAIEAVAAGGLVLLFVYPLLWAAFISALAYWARSQRTPVLRWCAAVLVLLSFKLESDWPSMDALAVAIKLGIMFAVLAGALGAVNALRTKPWTVGRARAAAAAALR